MTGSFLVIVFCILGQIAFAQDGIGTDSIKATIFVESGAEIFSTDESFNQQVLNKEFLVEGSSISYKRTKNVLKLGDVQSISETKNSKNNAHILKKKNTGSFKIAARQINGDVIKTNDFTADRFENNPSTNSTFSNGGIGRDCYVLSFFGFKASKAAIIKTIFFVKRNLNNLHNQLPYFYTTGHLNSGFLLVHSVRPPPHIS